MASAHGLLSRNDSQDKAEETEVKDVEEEVVTSAFKDKLEDEYDSDDEHHLCSLLLYFISKTLLNHLRDELKEPPMDRFAEQLFGKQDQSSRSRLPEEPSFMETFAKNLAKSAAKSAAKRAMGQSSSEKRTRDWTRGTSSNQINPEDFRGVAEFVIGMLSSNSKSEQPRKGEDDRKKDRKRKRDKDRSREVPRSRDVEDEGEKYGSDKERRKRRRHRVTFAEPYYDARPQEESYYPPPYESRRRRDRRQHEKDPSQGQEQEQRHGRGDYDEMEDREERRRRRRQRRYKRDLDLKTLKTELEAMSSTIISLNARGASHRDCEFYDRFVRKGGRLQDVIGSTLGQIRGLQDGDTEAEERRRKRDRRRREKR
ncbi:hypothetical protein FPOA_02717 [Fusarium poae]|uniref:Uncharacterized protein n=1 Tax=Fusarium poae TaxID=36050 RepID=A0A1B8B7T7_FUSPO|nr:hypothetical protein FPOA_02717 [Fusarium poae]